jgi:hypothetical protein
MHPLLIIAAALTAGAILVAFWVPRRTRHRRTLGRAGRRAISQARRADRRAYRDPGFRDSPQDRGGRQS